jgi:thiamine-phosphate diphosphorylase
MILKELYAITPDRGTDPEVLFNQMQILWKAGVHGIQLREKSANPEKLQHLARLLARRKKSSPIRNQGLLILNGDLVPYWPFQTFLPDAVQLGQGNWIKAQSFLGRMEPLPWIWSAHSPEEAAHAFSQGAEAVTISPIYPTRSHPDAAPGGLPLLQSTIQACPGQCVIALGGIELGRVSPCRRAGASAVGLLSGLFLQPDPAVAAKRLLREWDEAAILAK